jgi:tetratricopeptide (TPR) repeat protein
VSVFDIDVASIVRLWGQRTGYFAVLVVLLGAELLLFSNQPLNFLWAAVLSALILEVVWRVCRRIPKTQNGKLGFVISIACDDEKTAHLIRADFILTLRKLLRAGRLGKTFQVIEIPQHHAISIVDMDDAQRVRIAARAQFMLYGRVRQRQVNSKDHHYLELDGVVAHKPIPLEISKRLSEEFSELLPRKIVIPKDNDLLAFQFTSDWTQLVAKYIIGVAASVSADLDYAEQLYLDVQERVAVSPVNFPVIAKLRERVPKCIADIYKTRAHHAYILWAKTKEDGAMDLIGNFLAKIDQEKYGDYQLFNLHAIYAFVHDHDTGAAIEWLNKIRSSDRESVWHLNMAFLYAYDGKLRLALSHYRKALATEINPEVIGLIEDFVCHFISVESEKYHLYYCLGFFNWKFKGDTLQAAKDFREFLARCKPGAFVKEVELAKKWLSEIERDKK